MSLSIEVSFERDDELLAVTERLRDLPLKVSRHYQKPGGKYRRVYLRGEVLTAPETATERPQGGDRARGPARPGRPVNGPLQRPRDANQSRIKSGAKPVQSRYKTEHLKYPRPSREA